MTVDEILRELAGQNPPDTVAGLTAVDILTAMVDATQVTDFSNGLGCPFCGACMEEKEPHNHSCPYARAVLFLDANNGKT